MELKSLARFGRSPYRDSPYPTARSGLVAFEYFDSALDELYPVDDEDLLHDPGVKGKVWRISFAWRGIVNLIVLLIIISFLLSAMIFNPIYLFYKNKMRNSLIDGNIQINATGESHFFCSSATDLAFVF
jgi:hypothetical protein